MNDANATGLKDDRADELQEQFRKWLEPPSGKYRALIEKMLAEGETRLIINIDDLRGEHRDMADGLLKDPFEYVLACEKALLDVVREVSNYNIDDKKYHVGLRGSFGDHHLNPRTLKANSIGKMISLEGIVTRCSRVLHKMTKSMHYVEATQLHYAREYRDAYSLSTALPTGSTIPQVDADDNKLSMEYGFSIYEDQQRVSIQEMPERAPAGQLPRSVDVIIADDLVDKVKPGDRVQIVGLYRAEGGIQGGSATVHTFLLANNINLLSSKIGGGIAQMILTDIDIRNINLLAAQPNAFQLLSESLAPSIFGHQQVKEALLLLLLGGLEKNLPNGTHIRGDINILMVGDPSTAKSQLLRFMLNTAPLAIATTGRGSSGVGLTAAVTTDKDTGRRLEAGAMVLADRGIVCIDEFDKMSEIDRVAIHEVMEQQTVTIAKAGIHTTLNARCSVVAAANPIYGQYDIHKDPQRNIALPDSLLSRFDLLFVITDDVDEKKDRRISDHVLRMHRYQQPGLEEGAPAMDNLEQNLDVGAATMSNHSTETPVYEAYNPLLHGEVEGTGSRNGESAKKILNIAFVKKYIQYAKTRAEQPKLTAGASDHIVMAYKTLRNEQADKERAKRTSPLTPRTLETLIRLATAHAKVRLQQEVTVADARVAERILRFALFKESTRDVRNRHKKARTEPDGRIISDDETRAPSGVNTRGQSRSNDVPNVIDMHIGDEDMDEGGDMAEEDENAAVERAMQTSSTVPRSMIPNETALTDERLAMFRRRLFEVWNEPQYREETEFQVEALVPDINMSLPTDALFSMNEAMMALIRLTQDNSVYMSDGTVYKVQ